jgi:hypothetical protein
MDKEGFTKFIKLSVEDIWYSQRSTDPVKEQTEWLVKSLWPLYANKEDSSKRIQNLQDDIKKWSDGTFGMHRTANPMAYHLKKEITELITALDDLYRGTYSNSSTQDGIDLLATKYRRIRFELADCLMLLIDCASHTQINMDSLISAVEEKLEINKNRKWGTPDENGVIRHIEE